MRATSPASLTRRASSITPSAGTSGSSAASACQRWWLSLVESAPIAGDAGAGGDEQVVLLRLREADPDVGVDAGGRWSRHSARSA